MDIIDSFFHAVILCISGLFNCFKNLKAKEKSFISLSFIITTFLILSYAFLQLQTLAIAAFISIFLSSICIIYISFKAMKNNAKNELLGLIIIILLGLISLVSYGIYYLLNLDYL